MFMSNAKSGSLTKTHPVCVFILYSTVVFVKMNALYMLKKLGHSLLRKDTKEYFVGKHLRK